MVTFISLHKKALDPNRPIREADIGKLFDQLVGGGD
jgi:hypothetical protein